MNNFFELIGFEYRKIFARKSVTIAIILVIATAVYTGLATVIGTDVETGISYYDEAMMDKQFALELSGRVLDAELISQASAAYATIPSDVYPYTDSVEYKENARPYRMVFSTVDSAYTNYNEPLGFREFGQLTPQQAEGYYELRTEQYRLNLENNPSYSAENIELIMAMDEEVKKPFVLQYHSGYSRFFNFSITNSLMIMLLIAFAVSPIFSEEYQRKTDNLILTSKHGKGLQITAKIFTAVSFSLIIMSVVFFSVLFTCLAVYGIEGYAASIQNYLALITYNFTMAEMLLLLFVTTTFGVLMMVSIVLFLSANFSKSIVPLTIAVAIIIINLYGVSMPGIEKSEFFLPVALGDMRSVLTQYSFSLFELDLMLYQAVCVVSAVVSTALLAMTVIRFKRHEVS